ncbi:MULTISPECIES: cation diffusion facilitator family transporter [unclassified Wenzhouxiangella]|uniref:cation diffusion facilitator family transporter n=1 Tax=unclassified Wenzhouxiangella TaxID=2613841 RepID=UPI000E32689E|nr:MULTISPECIES: cation diffusion facilitator family transporter [unclassified Wenzhouxiangella]RFF28813.1 cation transporter [Wenzhouxiangella sp. 15181]RFP68210.1 cation transporter [Wenzhouxiangella sp. 15190]
MNSHDHHHHVPSSRSTLVAALCLTLGFAAVEFIAGLWAGSLALVADAGHMLTDSSALGLAAFAAWMAGRPASKRRTWGYGRTEVLAALINGVIMLLLVGSIAWHAFERFQDPRDISGAAVMGVALVGLVVNLLVFWALSRGERNLNVRGALLHVLGDLLGSVAALASGIVIMVTGWTPIDPILSLLICVLILIAAIRLLLDSAHVVMEGVPQGLDIDRVRATMTAVDGVQDIHDLHVWQVSSNRVALSAHVVVVDLGEWPVTLAALNRALLESHDIDHPTLQPELVHSHDCAHQPEACR